MTAPAGVGARTVPRVGRRTVLAAAALVPAVVLFACSFSSDMVAATGGDPLGIWRLLPAGPVAGDAVNAEISSFAFFFVALALLRGKRIGFWMALAMVAGALVVQGATLDHPVSAVAALAVGGILLATRRRYHVETGRREARLAGALLVGGAVAAAAAAIAGATGIGGVGAVADALGSLLDLATPVAVPGLATVGILLVIARLAYVVASVVILDPRHDDRPAETVAAARRTLRRVGAGALYPYQFSDACTAWADQAETAALAAASVGRCTVALGDPAGDPQAALEVLDAWIDRSRRDDLVPAVYQASTAVAAHLRGRGWRTVAIGREAIVDLAAFDLRTPRVANLRHTITRSRKGGVTTAWSASGLEGFAEPSVAAGLRKLDAEWRRSAGPQLGFTVGRFDPDDRSEHGIAVALDADGTPTAFVVVRPAGADGGWMLDVMRRARGGVPGALEASLALAIESLRDAGVRHLSLGLAPLAGLDPGSEVLAERLLARGARLVKPVYNHEGLAFFKNKFDPVWEVRYLAVPGWTALSTAVVALLRLHLGGGWRNVARSLAAGVAPAR